MNVTRKILALSLLASLSLSACSGGGSGLPRADNSGALNFQYNGPSSLSAFSWGQAYLADAQFLGPVSSGALGMQVQVRMRNEDGLLRYAQLVSDPKSPLYRHFLTPEQIGDQFGASVSDYAAAAKYFQQNGLHAGGWPQREQLFVSGSIQGFENAFGIKFGLYRKNGQTFVAPVGTAPHFQQALPVESVVGLVHAQPQRTYLARVPNSTLWGYTPQQVQHAFDFSGAFSKFDGSGISVAVVGSGPIMDQDMQKLHQLFGVRTATVTQPPVTDQGVSGALAGEPLPTPSPGQSPPPAYFNSPGLQRPPPATDPFGVGCQNSPYDLTQCNPEDFEAQLDTQTVATLAPGSNVLFYLGYNPADCFNGQGANACTGAYTYQSEGIGEMDAEIQQIIADNTADAVSISIGEGEPFGIGTYYDAQGRGFGPVEYATLVAEGMAVFVSSGDSGAYECSGYASQVGLTQFVSTPCSSYPASDPSVVSVGGVTAPLDDAGRLTGQITAWGDQTTAGGSGQFQNDIGSGGGLSGVFHAPPWQSGNSSVASVINGWRGQPDISLLADPHTGPAEVTNAGYADAYEVFPTGGTSLAAPQMAAMWALVLQACKADAVCGSKGSGAHRYRLGNPAPLLYGIYGNANQYQTTMTDVLYGSNSATSPTPGATIMPGNHAAPGYDLVTGVGLPYAGHLINTVIQNEGGTSPNLP